MAARSHLLRLQRWQQRHPSQRFDKSHRSCTSRSRSCNLCSPASSLNSKMSPNHRLPQPLLRKPSRNPLHRRPRAWVHQRWWVASFTKRWANGSPQRALSQAEPTRSTSRSSRPSKPALNRAKEEQGQGLWPAKIHQLLPPLAITIPKTPPN